MVPYLVGGIPTPLKNMKVSWDYYSQHMEKKTCSKPPTSYSHSYPLSMIHPVELDRVQMTSFKTVHFLDLQGLQGLGYPT